MQWLIAAQRGQITSYLSATESLRCLSAHAPASLAEARLAWTLQAATLRNALRDIESLLAALRDVDGAPRESTSRWQGLFRDLPTPSVVPLPRGRSGRK